MIFPTSLWRLAAALITPVFSLTAWSASNIQITSPAPISIPVGGTGQASLSVANTGSTVLNYQFASTPYTFATSDQAGGPTYSWIDISTTGGTQITGLGDDNTLGPYNIGFSFPFFGNNYTGLSVCSNGFVTFSSSTAKPHNNAALPASAAPGDMIAFFWDDLNFSNSGSAYYKLVDPGTFVLQFKEVSTYSDASKKISCELILQSDGTFTLQYLRVDTANSCTVGIQNTLRDVSVQAVYNAAFLHPNMAIRFQQRPLIPWVSVPAGSSSVAAGDSALVNLTFNSTGMQTGNYSGNLVITSNDTAQPSINVPVSMHVQLYLDQWKSGYFTEAQLAAPNISGSNADPDGDGIPNWMECALYTDPWVNGRNQNTFTHIVSDAISGLRYLTLNYRYLQSNPEFTFVPEVATHVGSWNSGSTYTEVLSNVNNGDGTFTQIVRDKTAMSASGSRFMRLRVDSAANSASHPAVGIRAPIQPGNLIAVGSGSQIQLKWADYSSNETGFEIERKTGAGGAYASIRITAPDVTSYVNSGLADFTTYFYRIRATNSGGNSTYSSEVSAATTTSPPVAPSNFVATLLSSPTRVSLSWSDNSGNETGFRIQRKTGAGGTYTPLTLTNPNVVSYSDPVVADGTLYYYRLYSTNSQGDSAALEVSVTTTGSTPPVNAPTGLTVTSFSAGMVNLAWTDNSSNEVDFKLERKLGVGGVYTLLARPAQNATSYQDSTVIAGTTYYYRIRASTVAADSLTSNEVNTATPMGGRPFAPTQVVAVSTTTSSITINWADASGDEQGFKLECRVGGQGSFTQIATPAQNATTYQHSGLSVGVQYFYRLRAYNGFGESLYSNEAISAPWNGPATGTDYLGNPFVTTPAPVLTFAPKTNPGLTGIDYSFPEQTAKGVALLSRFPAFMMSDRRIHTDGPWYNNDAANLHFSRGLTTIGALPNFRFADTAPTTLRKYPRDHKWHLLGDPIFWGHAVALANELEAMNPTDPRIPALRTFGIDHNMSNDKEAFMELGRYAWKSELHTTDLGGKGALFPCWDVEVSGGFEFQREALGWMYLGAAESASDAKAPITPITYGQWQFSVGAFWQSSLDFNTGQPEYFLPSNDFLAGYDPTLQACQENGGILSMDGYLQAIWGRNIPFYKRNADTSLQLTSGLPVYNDATADTAYGATLSFETGESQHALDDLYRQVLRMYLQHYRRADAYPANSTLRRSTLTNTKIGAWSRYTNEGVLGINQNDRPIPDWLLETLIGMYLMTSDDIIMWSSDFNFQPQGLGANYSQFWSYNTQGVAESVVKAAHRYSALDPIHHGTFQWCWFNLPVYAKNETAGHRYFEKPIAIGKIRNYQGRPWLELFLAWPALDNTPKTFKVWLDNGTQQSNAYTVQLANGRSYFYDAWQLPDTFLNATGQDVYLRTTDLLNVQRTWRGDWRQSVNNSSPTPADYTGP